MNRENISPEKPPLRHDWTRPEGEEQDQGKATFPELFFDLVFVFALIQLSHTLAEDFGSSAIFEAAILVLALWWVWIHTTWLTNLLNTGKEPVRLMLFAMMFCGVLMAIALPDAFSGQGLVFASIYCVMQISRSLFAVYAFRHVDRQACMTFVRITIWLTAAAVPWIAGGLSGPEARLLFWSLAIAIEYVGPALHYYVPGLNGRSGDTLDISGEHLAERCALFVIICLGETILTTGRTAAGHMNSGLTFMVFCFAFASTVAMWWIYFHHSQEEASEKAERAARPEKVARQLFNYGHLPIVGGIILTAVGEDFSLSHAAEHTTLRHGLAIIGGPALFLAGAIFLRISSSGGIPRARCLGLLALLAGFALPSLPLYVLQALVTLVLYAVALGEYLAPDPLRKKIDAG